MMIHPNYCNNLNHPVILFVILKHSIEKLPLIMRKKGIIVSEDAMAKKLEALDDNHTRNLVKLPN